MDASALIIGLLIISTLTGLFTEGTKKLLDSKSITYASNVIATIWSIVTAVFVFLFYILYTSTAISGIVMLELIAVCGLSWLCAMLGYDKVVQAITQIKSSADSSETSE